MLLCDASFGDVKNILCPLSDGPFHIINSLRLRTAIFSSIFLDENSNWGSRTYLLDENATQFCNQAVCHNTREQHNAWLHPAIFRFWRSFILPTVNHCRHFLTLPAMDTSTLTAQHSIQSNVCYCQCGLVHSNSPDSYFGRPSLLLDSRASRHMTGIILFNVHAISPCYIGLPNGS